MDRILGQHCRHIFRHIGQCTAPQRLHDHHSQTLLMGKAQTFQACLVVYIHVVELQLAEFPAVITVEDLLEHFQAIMEAETQVTDLTLCLCLFRKGDNTGLLDMLPTIPVQGMQEINIDVVRLQTLQFLIQNPVKVLLVIHHPNRQLGGQGHFFTVTVLQAQAGDPLAILIGIGGVHIGKAVVDGSAQGFDCPLLIDAAVLILRKTHHTKAQNRRG